MELHVFAFTPLLQGQKESVLDISARILCVLFGLGPDVVRGHFAFCGTLFVSFDAYAATSSLGWASEAFFEAASVLSSN